MSGIQYLADHFGISGDMSLPPTVGAGGVYSRVEYNPWYAGVGVFLILATMFAFLRLDLGRNLLGTGKPSK
jgi:hypothetical protein